jgi:hypothetical protein
MSRDRSPAPEYSEGSITYQDASGNPVRFDIRMRPRGNSRRERAVCTFPPLRLNFPKSEVKGSLFDSQNNLKLVTHCRSTESFQNYVVREYLVYRLLNALTETSFDVRLLRVTYEDSEKDKKGREFQFKSENILYQYIGDKIWRKRSYILVQYILRLVLTRPIPSPRANTLRAALVPARRFHHVKASNEEHELLRFAGRNSEKDYKKATSLKIY